MIYFSKDSEEFLQLSLGGKNDFLSILVFNWFSAKQKYIIYNYYNIYLLSYIIILAFNETRWSTYTLKPD